MTNKPMEFKFKIYRAEHGFNIVYDRKTTIEMEVGEYHTIEAGPVLEKIKRLELALQKCKEQRNWFIKCLLITRIELEELKEANDKELESILEGK